MITPLPWLRATRDLYLLEKYLLPSPGVVAQDVPCGGSHQADESTALSLAAFGNLESLNKLKLRSVFGNLRIKDLGDSLNLFSVKFADSFRILVTILISLWHCIKGRAPGIFVWQVLSLTSEEKSQLLWFGRFISIDCYWSTFYIGFYSCCTRPGLSLKPACWQHY